jgi:hypothetical protein
MTSCAPGGALQTHMSTRKKVAKTESVRALTTADHQEKFLKAFSEHANLSLAAKTAGVARNEHYRWLEDPEYVIRFKRAYQCACDAVDAEIRRRGVLGYEEPVFFQGRECGQITKFDSTLLIFFAKGMMPEKYKDNYKADINLTGKVDVELNHRLTLRKLSDEQLEQLERIFLLERPPEPDPEPGADPDETDAGRRESGEGMEVEA